MELTLTPPPKAQKTKKRENLLWSQNRLIEAETWFQNSEFPSSGIRQALQYLVS